MNALFRNKSLLFTVLCSLGLLLVILAGIANIFAQRQATRGVVQGFPGSIAYSDVPGLGVNVALEHYDKRFLGETLKPILGGQLRWVRQTFPWAQIEPEPGRFEWDRWDALFATLDETLNKDILILAVLDTPPGWFQPPTSNLQPFRSAQGMSPISDLQSPISKFAYFASEFARRYGDRIDYYQVWDEPNLGAKWGGSVEPAAYAATLRQAGEAIRANDSEAIIVLAGLAPTVEQSSRNMTDWLFLRRLYEIGAKDYFDIVAGKPYGFYTGPEERQVDPGVLNFSHILLMREEMEQHGDAGKPLWATQWGWNALPEDWSGAPSLWGQANEAEQAEYTIQAIRRAASEWPWMTAMFLENFRPDAPADDPRWGFALVWQDGWPRPVYDAFVQAAEALPLIGPGYHPVAVRAGGTYTGNPAADFQGRWRFSELGADWEDETGAKVSFDFHGTGLALRVRRAADRAHLYVTIDGQPANALPRDGRGAFLQLIPPNFTQADIAIVPVARGMPPGPHQAEITTERGWNQWALVGWSVESRIADFGLRIADWVLAALGVLCAVGAVWNGRRVEWGRLGRAVSAGYTRLSEAVQVALTVLMAGVMYLGAWMTWGGQSLAVFRRLGEGPGLTAMLGLGALFYFSPWLILTVLSGLGLFALILLRLDLGLGLAVLCAPFFFMPRPLFERVFSMVEIVILMCFVSWLRFQISDFNTRRATRNSNPQYLISNIQSLDWAALAFIAASLASLFVAEYKHVAMRELRVIVLEPALLYLMLRTTLSRHRARAMWRVVDALALAGAAVAVIGLVQITLNVNIITAEEGARRLRSVYGSPNNAALFLGRVLPVLVAVALVGRGPRRKWYALAILPVAPAILLTLSKGALLLGVPASLAAILLLWQGRRAWGWLIGLGLAGAIGFLVLLQVPQIGARLALTGGTSFVRLNLWKSSLMMIRDHPWLGVGLDNFLYSYRGRYMLPGAWVESTLSHPHNVILDYAARLGLIGLAVGMWLQVAFWKIALPLRKLEDPMNKALAIGIMASMANFLSHGIVDASFFVVDLAYVFFMTSALVQELSSELQTTKTVAPH